MLKTLICLKVEVKKGTASELKESLVNQWRIDCFRVVLNKFIQVLHNHAPQPYRNKK